MSHCNLGRSDYMSVMKRSLETPPGFKITDFEDKSLLIVDDDDPLRGRLSRAMEKNPKLKITLPNLVEDNLLENL